MKVYQINYDLRNQRSYEPLIDKIKSYGTWAHPQQSCWVISIEQTALQVRDALAGHMDNDDGLLVTRLHGEAAWQNLSSPVADWLKRELSQAA